MQARVLELKEQLEHLFPGKWLTGSERSRHIPTGLAQLDSSVARGIARKRISEWTGPLSSGKTSLLRTAITHWCKQGLNVAYIDAQGKLFAADWAQVTGGKFWIVRPPDVDTLSSKVTSAEDAANNVAPLVCRRALLAQEAIWSADQFIRCNAFDVVILDLGSLDPADAKRRGMSYSQVPGRIYARLQRSLDRCQAALIIVRDMASSGWGASTRFTFNWGTQLHCQPGLCGNVLITPGIKCLISKDGIEQTVEVESASTVQNRLFTHPQVPDRRSSKV